MSKATKGSSSFVRNQASQSGKVQQRSTWHTHTEGRGKNNTWKKAGGRAKEGSSGDWSLEGYRWKGGQQRARVSEWVGLSRPRNAPTTTLRFPVW